ncbi:MAG: hypothetical protein BV459_04205 [Thermoplasmata archaeon M11B2D]|nr:MAG: hypothetical protein BV459_04205 [Thermoplasmata archaeon M11B2D]
MNHVAEKNVKTQDTPLEDRETQIFNLLCNISLLLMALVTSAFSELLTTVSKEMVAAIHASLNAAEADTKNLADLQRTLPRHITDELLQMKQDLKTQLMEKKPQLAAFLTDPRFDMGIAIVEHTPFPLPKLTQDLSEPHLLGYLALLQTNDQRFSTMFQELLDWMNTLPQPPKNK